jgi:predicted Zn-dependent protease
VTAMAAQRGNHSNLVVGAASLGAQLVNQRYSRGAELESDEYGMIYMSRAGYDPRAAVDLQRTFVRLAAERPTQGWLEGLFASHPPSAERVERNEATLARLPAGGEIGRERFQAATSRLRAMQPAYDLYDEGRAALADGRLDEAQNLAERAICITADEADFHALLGDVALARGRPRDAADDLRDAIARNDRYFYYPLKLGTALLDLNELAASAEQFEASLELLPTADAHYGLGRIAQRSGDIASALEHYRLAASSSSDTGRAAEDAIVQIDLPSNPGAYLQVATGLDSQSRLLVDITNPTRYSVTDIDLTIRYVDGGGAIVTTGRTVTSTLPPGTTQRLSTGLGPFASPNGYEILLERARVIEP